MESKSSAKEMRRNRKRMKEANAGLKVEFKKQQQCMRTLCRQQSALIDLLGKGGVSERKVETVFRKMTRGAAQALGIERAGIWRLDEDRQQLAGLVLYERGKSAYSKGVSIEIPASSGYFEVLDGNKPLVVGDVRADPRLNEFAKGYHEPLGIVSALEIPVSPKGGPKYLVRLEQVGEKHDWAEYEIAFGKSLAKLVIQVLEAVSTNGKVERLQASERLHRQVLSNVTDTVVITDDAGNFTFVCPNVHYIFGYSQNEVEQMGTIGTLIEDFKVRPKIKGLGRGRGMGNLPATAKDKKGRTRQLLVTANRVALGGGTCLYMIRDVTDFMAAESKLSRSEEQYRTLVNASPFGIQVSDPDGRVVFSNPAHHEMLGFKGNEPIGKHVWDFSAEEGAKSRIRQDYQTIIKEQPSPYPYFSQNRTKDGRSIELQINWDYLRDSEGKLTGIVSIISDVTDLRRAERGLQREVEYGTRLSRISSEFINLPLDQFDRKIEDCLGSLGELTGLDRIFFAEFLEGTGALELTHEWINTDFTSPPDVEKRLELSSFPWSGKKWKRGEPVIIPRVAKLPKSAEEERSFLSALKVKSHLNFPVLVDGNPVCLLGFHSIRQERAWTEDLIKWLKLVGQILGHAVARKRMEENLRLTKERFRLAFDQQFQFMAILSPDGRVLEINDLVLRALKVDRGAYVGKYFWEAPPWNYVPERQAYIQARVREAMERDQPVPMQNYFQVGGGPVRYTEGVLSAVRNTDGSLRYILAQATDVTERKLVQEDLRRSKRRLDHAQRIARMGDFSWDLENGEVSWSDGMYGLLGYAKSTRVDMRFVEEEIHHPRDREAVRRWLTEAIDSGLNILSPKEYRLLNKKGAVLHVRTTGVIEKTAGKAIRVFATVQDITERKVYEERLLQSEKRFRALYDFAPVGISVTDANGKPLQTNRELQKMLGYSEEEFRGMSVFDYTHQDDREASKRRIREFVNGEKDTVRTEKRYISKGGDTVWVQFSVSVIRSETGDFQFMVTAATNITERKQTEEKLKVSDRRFQAFMNEIPAFIYIKDESLQLIYTNGFSLGLTKNPKEEWMGTKSGNYFPNPVARQLETLDRRVLKEHSVFEWEGEVKTLSGEHTWIHDTKFPLTGAVGEKLIGGVTVDITAQKRAEETLRQAHHNLELQVEQRTAELKHALEKAESADRLKSLFVATMSHEIRNPLNAIIGFTGILLQGMTGPLNPEQQKQLRIVRDSSRHLLAIVNDVLDISKIEAGRLEIFPRRFNVRDSIRKVVQILSPQAEVKGLDLQVHVDSAVGEVVADEKRFEQVLINLLSNAIKFTNRGNVLIRSKMDGTDLVIRVKDSGLGIRSEDMEKLFTPFQQIHSNFNDRQEGSGLGLVISRRLARLMGGEILVKSRFGEGSTFTFKIPLRD